MGRSGGDQIRGVGSSLGAWFLQALERRNPALKDRVAKALGNAHIKAYRISGGKFLGRPGAPSLLLTTTGRKSGRPRTTALFYLPDGDRQVVVASYGGDVRHPQWYLNLIANPEVSVQIDSRIRQVRAAVANGAERAALWPKVVENWPGYQGYQERTDRELPVIVLTER